MPSSESSPIGDVADIHLAAFLVVNRHSFREAFDIFDADGDGLLSLEDMVQSAGRLSLDLENSQLRQWHQKAAALKTGREKLPALLQFPEWEKAFDSINFNSVHNHLCQLSSNDHGNTRQYGGRGVVEDTGIHEVLLKTLIEQVSKIEKALLPQLVMGDSRSAKEKRLARNRKFPTEQLMSWKSKKVLTVPFSSSSVQFDEVPISPMHDAGSTSTCVNTDLKTDSNGAIEKSDSEISDIQAEISDSRPSSASSKIDAEPSRTKAILRQIAQDVDSLRQAHERTGAFKQQTVNANSMIESETAHVSEIELHSTSKMDACTGTDIEDVHAAQILSILERTSRQINSLHNHVTESCAAKNDYRPELKVVVGEISALRHSVDELSSNEPIKYVSERPHPQETQRSFDLLCGMGRMVETLFCRQHPDRRKSATVRRRLASTKVQGIDVVSSRIADNIEMDSGIDENVTKTKLNSFLKQEGAFDIFNSSEVTEIMRRFDLDKKGFLQTSDMRDLRNAIMERKRQLEEIKAKSKAIRSAGARNTSPASQQPVVNNFMRASSTLLDQTADGITPTIAPGRRARNSPEGADTLERLNDLHVRAEDSARREESLLQAVDSLLGKVDLLLLRGDPSVGVRKSTLPDWNRS